MAIKFKDHWLSAFYLNDQPHRKIPNSLSTALFRKLQLLDAATHENDLRAPPGNRFEPLQGKLSGWYSIRVNKQYRLIFRWENTNALDVYLDPHEYR